MKTLYFVSGGIAGYLTLKHASQSARFNGEWTKVKDIEINPESLKNALFGASVTSFCIYKAASYE